MRKHIGVFYIFIIFLTGLVIGCIFALTFNFAMGVLFAGLSICIIITLVSCSLRLFLKLSGYDPQVQEMPICKKGKCKNLDYTFLEAVDSDNYIVQCKCGNKYYCDEFAVFELCEDGTKVPYMIRSWCYGNWKVVSKKRWIATC